MVEGKQLHNALKSVFDSVTGCVCKSVCVSKIPHIFHLGNYSLAEITNITCVNKVTTAS